MAYMKIGFFVIACSILIDAQVIPVRCPKKCGSVRKIVNKVLECACGSLEPMYSVIGEVQKCGCGKVYIDTAKDICGCGKVYIDTTKDICGCKVPNIDSQVVGLLDYITGVEKKCGCQVTPCTCQVKPCGCQGTPCGCQAAPCGCQIIPSGSQQTIRMPNPYEVLSSIDIPRCGSFGKMPYTVDLCSKCSKFDYNCRNLPHEIIPSAIPGCIAPVVDVPGYVYSVQTPIVEVLPLEYGCGVGKCGCGLANCGCGLPKVAPCSCGVVNCGCIGPCSVCGTGSCGCGIPNCGCLNICGCVPECSCVIPCTCDIANCGFTGSCGCTGSGGCSGSCGCVGPCGCANTECGCRKRSRKSSIPPPFL